MCLVAFLDDLLGEVDRRFAVTGRGLEPWPDPHADRGPRDDEYSRVADADKWRIVGARADAWLMAIGDRGLARVERHAAVEWEAEPGTRISNTDRAVPQRPGAVTLVIARSAIGDVPGTGITFGVGEPAVCVGWLPQCGCDACDSGSQYELDEVDRIVLSVVSGTFRRLTSGGRQITQLDPHGWSASGDFARGEVEAVLARPTGWHEISGAAWTELV